MTSLEKMLGLLDAFTPDAPVWSIEDLMRRSGTTRSTCYRYLKVLARSGFLAPVAQGAYILGPRIIELDRSIRACDPVYTAGGPPMQRLAARTGHSALLCVLYSDTVMCVREELERGAPRGLFSRGQKRPLFSGAASKVILAHLPPHQLRSLYAKHGAAIAAAGLGRDRDAYRATLRQIREDGYCTSTGEFAPGIRGIAAPLFNAAGHVLGSLTLAMAASAVRASEVPALAEAVMKAAAEATERIGADDRGAGLRARAVG